MHCSSDIETLMNDGICFNDCFSQEYVKYVNMWNFPWMGGGGGGGTFHFKISRVKADTFQVIRYKCDYMPSFNFPRYRIKGHHSG